MAFARDWMMSRTSTKRGDEHKAGAQTVANFRQGNANLSQSGGNRPGVVQCADEDRCQHITWNGQGQNQCPGKESAPGKIKQGNQQGQAAP